ncbi:MAG: hypothetical protein LBL83_13155, partial [Clostridiales bacterium]|nr:hypothetical protein [Clostridiales bacterium]
GAAWAARRHIVRRALRYHGGHTAAQIAYRYCWTESAAQHVLDALRDGREAVEDAGVYYHAGVYGKAARLAVLSRRRLVAAVPQERYAALLSGRVRSSGTPKEQLAHALGALRGERFAPDVWEDAILPARVAEYRQALLDELLSQGEILWRLNGAGTAQDDAVAARAGIAAAQAGASAAQAGATAAQADAVARSGAADAQAGAVAARKSGVATQEGAGASPGAGARPEDAQSRGLRLSFHEYGDFDWESKPPLPCGGLDADEQAICAALRERGAVFMQGLSPALNGRSPREALLRLAGRGLVRSDSLAPVRQLQEYARQGGAPPGIATAGAGQPFVAARTGALPVMHPGEPGRSGANAAELLASPPGIAAAGAHTGALPVLPGAPSSASVRAAAPGYAQAISGEPLFGSAAARARAKTAARERARAHAAMPSSGRWELARELAPETVERQLERAFDRVAVLCRETARGLPWDQALAVLRVWELTGRARRGYFIEGLSGAQFVRESDYAATVQLLARPARDIIWLSAADPAQQWGKCLPHRPGRSFMNVPGTAVALCAGAPVAVFMRFGQALRIFGCDAQPQDAAPLSPAQLQDSALLSPAQPQDSAPLPPAPADIMKAFVRQYSQRRIYASRKSVTVRQYGPEAERAMISAGFSRYIRDYVVYRD